MGCIRPGRPGSSTAAHGRDIALPTSTWLLGLFLLGLLPRLLILLVRPDGLQAWEYDTLARNIVAGNGYVITHFGHLVFAFGDGNLYSFLSAAVYALVGYQPLVLAVVQAILVSLAAPVIFAIGRPAFGWPVAALGAALAAVHPGLLMYSLKLHPLGIDVLLMALSVLWIRRAGNGTRSGLMSGLALGMMLMSRPTFFLGGLAGLAVRWFASRQRLLPMVLPIVVALVVAAPWVFRNWAVLGKPVFISTSLEDVWKGNNELASGSSYLSNGQDIFSAASPQLQSRLQQANELQQSDVFAGEIMEFVSQQPTNFVVSTARKFAYFWWLSPQAGILYPTAWVAPYAMYFVVAMAFALVGAVGIVRRGTAEEVALLSTLVAISLTLAAIHALSYVEGRHRWGIEPLLLLLTARGIFMTAAWLKSRRRTFAPSGGSTAALS
jgi:Dolichyl-phosphate-mannose-protein mannosyltransferase